MEKLWKRRYWLWICLYIKYPTGEIWPKINQWPGVIHVAIRNDSMNKVKIAIDRRTTLVSDGCCSALGISSSRIHARLNILPHWLDFRQKPGSLSEKCLTGAFFTYPPLITSGPNNGYASLIDDKRENQSLFALVFHCFFFVSRSAASARTRLVTSLP